MVKIIRVGVGGIGRQIEGSQQSADEGFKKSIYKVIGQMRISFVFVVLLLLPFGNIFCQNIPEDKILRYEDAIFTLDVTACPLHEIYICDDTLSVAFRKAGTLYPELCGSRISLRYGSGKTTIDRKSTRLNSSH